MSTTREDTTLTIPIPEDKVLIIEAGSNHTEYKNPHKLRFGQATIKHEAAGIVRGWTMPEYLEVLNDQEKPVCCILSGHLDVKAWKISTKTEDVRIFEACTPR